MGRTIGRLVDFIRLLGAFTKNWAPVCAKSNLSVLLFCFGSSFHRFSFLFWAIVLKGDSTVAHSNCCKQVLPHFGWKISCRFLSMSEEQHMTTFHLNSSYSTYTHDAASPCSSRGFCDMNHSENPKPCSFNF